MINYYDLLKPAQKDYYSELLARRLRGSGGVEEIEGVPPLTFQSDGTPLIDWYIKGKTVQNGTPTPTAPIQPQSCGDLETIGEHSGQYKIPILCGNQTTNIYLGETQSTRAVKKLALKGTESIAFYSNGASGIGFRINVSDMILDSGHNGYCNHFSTVNSVYGLDDNAVQFGSNVNKALYFVFSVATVTELNLSNAQSVINWIKSQYANGTPVTVWYVLATPETATINEPLMKIGDYADSIDKAGAGVNIPTSDGINTLSVNTSVQPSEVYIKYKK